MKKSLIITGFLGVISIVSIYGMESFSVRSKSEYLFLSDLTSQGSSHSSSNGACSRGQYSGLGAFNIETGEVIPIGPSCLASRGPADTAISQHGERAIVPISVEDSQGQDVASGLAFANLPRFLMPPQEKQDGQQPHDLSRIQEYKMLRREASVALGKITERDWALVYAVATQDYGLAEDLLKLGANPSPDINRPPLHRAIQLGAVSLVTLLLQYNADCSQKDEEFLTPIDLVYVVIESVRKRCGVYTHNQDTLSAIKTLVVSHTKRQKFYLRTKNRRHPLHIAPDRTDAKQPCENK